MRESLGFHLPSSYVCAHVLCVSTDSQLLLFKGKKLDDPSRTVQELKIKSKSTLFLRCTKVQVVKPAVKPAASPAAMELQQKLQNQGAGSISLRMAEDFVSLAKSLDVENPVVKGVNLFYKSNRNIAYARQIVKAEKEEKMKQAKEAAEKAAEKADKMEVDESSSNATTDASPKKKKKQTYKDMMKEFKLKKQSSEEAREAHREFLKKNLGGGHFDKLDKI